MVSVTEVRQTSFSEEDTFHWLWRGYLKAETRSTIIIEYLALQTKYHALKIQHMQTK